MKFGKQLQLGTYSPWRRYYIGYSRLKREIFRLAFLRSRRDGPGSTLSSRTHSFIELPAYGKVVEEESLGEEVKGFIDYGSTHDSCGSDHGSLTGEGARTNSTDFFDLLQEEIDKINKFYLGKLATLTIDVETITSKIESKEYAHFSSENSMPLNLVKLRDVYIELAALRSYIELNKTGFYKILKKYDKVVNEPSKAMQTWLPIINEQSFTQTKKPTALMEKIAMWVSRDKLLEWETFATEEATRKLDDVFPSVRISGLVVSLGLFFVSCSVELIHPADPCAERCLSLVLLVVSLWVSEAIPYYATALLILPLTVLMDVFRNESMPTEPMTRDIAADKVMRSMFNHTTFLLLGGYAISSAISRCKVEISIASILQTFFGKHPRAFVLAIMFLGLFLSMWISNHTAPILCSTIILPVLKDLPPDSQYTKTLLLGLAFACNFGGMMTPIASVNNVLAVSSLEHAGIDISFGMWMIFSVPFGVISVLLSWVIIMLAFDTDDVKEIPLIIHHQMDNLGQKRRVSIVTVSAITIGMFATSNATVDTFGDIGIISLLFLTFIFGSGLLTEVDFNSMNWHTLCLVGSGDVLGKAVTSSGLLHHVTQALMELIPLENAWAALVGILVIVCIVGTFISHTVAAIVLMPVIANIGVKLDMPEGVVIGSAFAISSAMSLPFSSFPNLNAAMLKDDHNEPFLRVTDFLRVGIPITIITLGLISTLGLSLIHASI